MWPGTLVRTLALSVCKGPSVALLPNVGHSSRPDGCSPELAPGWYRAWLVHGTAAHREPCSAGVSAEAETANRVSDILREYVVEKQNKEEKPSLSSPDEPRVPGV